ncbi:hypothetical protein [Thalassospira profundimaris]|uniref:Uncharacterized protein n=1 Tax=Thalassospira profundimaris TaxID=502049 RepID=A0A367X2R1_9PROT|nr:hypothetical protein [Thalassospira profundimaris]RCK47945.1 hypothetical protein TH30_05765 [Thalassospira profundimaris]
MMKLHLANFSLYSALLAALITVGMGRLSSAYAQSDDVPSISSAPRLAFGSDLGAAILPPAGHNGISRYFSGRTRSSFLLGPEPDDTGQGSQFWLEMDGTRNTHNGLSAQIGLGYSPTPGLGIAVGPFLDLSASKSENIGIYQTGGYAFEQPRRPLLLSESDNDINDAGLAASLSYMPLQDIWIGLHGSVSRNLTPSQPDQSVLDGIDAMLGLTARYRIEF